MMADYSELCKVSDIMVVQVFKRS